MTKVSFTKKVSPISTRTVGRLSLYRRLLMELQINRSRGVYSHELARLADVTPAQVRRDLMAIGYSGTPAKGYQVVDLLESISHFLHTTQGQKAVLVGIGNLGRALLSHLSGRKMNLSIVAAFDKDDRKVNRVIHSCRCYPMEELGQVVTQYQVQTGIITVPEGEAQTAADDLVSAGVQGLLNFAPVRLRVPPNVFIQNNDITMSLDVVAYYARMNASERVVANDV